MAGDRPVRWEACGQDGCGGVRLAAAAWCLEHVATHDTSALEAELKRIGDEGTIDARGVSLSADLLARILDAAPHEDDRRVIKAAQFDRATFQGGASFDGTIFRGEVWFSGAVFQGGGWFSDVTFQGEAAFAGTTFQREARFGAATFKRWARFSEATFGGGAWFDGVNFQQVAGFDRARFQGEAWFIRATFHREAGFGRTVFERVTAFAGATFQHAALFARTEFQDEVGFGGVTFRREARFDQANFRGPRQVGPLVARQLVLDGAVFGERVQIEAATAVLCARRVKFSAGVRFRLRWALVVLDDADLAAPASLAGVPPWAGLDEQDAARRWQRLPPGPRAQRWRPRLLSLCRADVAGLRTANVDLRACRFNGAHNLDKFRIEGEPLFARTSGWWRTRRKTLAEEQQWRVSRSGHWRTAGWYPEACQPPASTPGDSHTVLAAVQIAALYRELRKGREDAKDEPGAADFYYGEMELRRHNQEAPRTERLILWLYWLFAGYSLRGLRALIWLAVVVIGLAGLLQSIGFNGGDPPFRDALIYAAQSTVSINSNNRALIDHVSWAGESIRIALRLVGPLLLGLALLSVRNRVKR
jgi:uncharacterized protein YjbI with pentapeptide repeats